MHVILLKCRRPDPDVLYLLKKLNSFLNSVLPLNSNFQILIFLQTVVNIQKSKFAFVWCRSF